MSRRKAILAAFSLVALISFGAGIVVDQYFSQNGASNPKPEAGQTHSVIANKARVYLTRGELILFYLPGFSFFVWFFAIAYFGVRWRFMKVPVKVPEFDLKKKKDNDR